MRLLPFLLARLALGLAFSFAVAAGSGTQAWAVDYPWCANFADGAGSNCGFATYQQCMLTARGSGGYCAQNTMYTAPAAAARSHPARKRRPAKKE
jgi:hypothetical protein